MWPRVAAFLVGVWLLLSPFVFRHPKHAFGQWATDLACASAVMALSALSFWDRARRVHLVLVAVSGWLVGFGYFAGGYPSPPAFQNEILTGLVLLLLAILPSEANLPPRAWRRYFEDRAAGRLK